MYSFCTHSQNQHVKKPLYKGLLVFIELFKLQTDSTEYKAKSLILSHFGAI